MSKVKTYLGQKGYTIIKDSISPHEQQFIRDDLNVKPYVPKTSMVKPKPFPVYRESSKKLYVPRYYGIKMYGEPQENKLIGDATQQEKMDSSKQLTFKGNLRDYQVPIVNKYIDVAKNIGGGLIEVYCGGGKTCMALNIISQLGKKTLIIVHKDFLLQQWVERINEFLPDARIGRIQGQIVDTDDKDIVIGMLQSLSMKSYEPSTFADFGLTVIDECHHIAAEVFSNALFQIVTPYMLGLSATMNRKDGLTRIFKMFIGEVAYKLTREDTDDVLVKAIEFKTKDEDFNNTELNFRGQTHYSLMIKKICEFNPRTEFLLKVLTDTISDDKNKQIMILAHNKNLLTYLFKAIEHRNMATVGYYIGGMKQKDLKESENKRVIVATYAMAEEALDIKTLSTLIMATPKTDVTQAVGRILRMKHEQTHVIDIVDVHDSFRNQFRKRQVFYKKNGYKIIHTDSDSYESNIANWRVLYDPSNQINKTNKTNKTGKTGKQCKSNTLSQSVTDTNNIIDIDTSDGMPGKCLIEL